MINESELDGERMIELAALRTETYSCLTDKTNKNRKAKDTKMCVIKQKLKFEDYKHYLKAGKTRTKIN